jgi:hypothetical protein
MSPARAVTPLTTAFGRILAAAQDVAILLAITVLVPVVILLIGLPFALLAWVVATVISRI